MIPGAVSDTLRAPNDTDLVGDGHGQDRRAPARRGRAPRIATLLTHDRPLPRLGQPDRLVGRHEPPEPPCGPALPALRLERRLLLLPCRWRYHGTTYYLGSSELLVLVPDPADGDVRPASEVHVERGHERTRRRASTPTAASSTSSTRRPTSAIFIIRQDGRLYVPAAFHKSSIGLAELRRQLDGGVRDPGQRPTASTSSRR